MTAEAEPGAPAVQPQAGADQNGGAPDEGQGAGLGLYDLDSVPAELRPYVEEQVKKIDGNVTKKFMEHAEYKKQWEPFEQVEGLSDVDPEDLQWFTGFREIAQDPEQLENWWNELGEQHGFFEDGAGGEGAGAEGQEGGEAEGQPPEWAQGLIDRISGLEEQLGPVSQSVTQQQQQQRIQAANEQITSELSELKDQHGEFNVDAVKKLALAYDGAPDAIKRAHQDLLEITGQAQGELVDGKLDQPGQAVSGGQSDTSPEEFERLDDPALKAAARARFAGASR